ncbi:MAG: glycoside hydrolase family 127 protein, partial [Clostridia bacterium]|nr:glycoside hydrolase family 127 protein [Clostridia bacterium]
MKKTARPPRVADVHIADDFWGEYQRLIKESVIPYQWEALNDCIPDADRSGCIHNFMVAAGRKEGEHYGWYFQDSDLYKWLEAVAYSLVLSPDAELEKTADWVIDLMADAQREDGYLDTFYQIAHPGEEWTCLREYHELYCAGHLIEAAVAYADATGKTKFL